MANVARKSSGLCFDHNFYIAFCPSIFNANAICQISVLHRLGARPEWLGLGLDGWETRPKWLGARPEQLDNSFGQYGWG